jgi:phosphoribosylamine--glycine ligase
MGAFAPSPLVSVELQARIMREIVEPVVAGLHTEGHDYCGFLYAGLMVTCDGPKVIEFNVRFGDPEAQVVIPMMSEPLAPRLAAAAAGALDSSPIAFHPEPHVGVVLASAGYPGSGPSAVPIAGLDTVRSRDVLVFHAGTARRGSEVVTAGGRVLTVVGRGTTYETAIGRAYEGVAAISFDGMQYRHDIGRKAMTP